MKKILILVIPFIMSASSLDLKSEIEFLKDRIKKLEELVNANNAESVKVVNTIPEIRIQKIEEQVKE